MAVIETTALPFIEELPNLEEVELLIDHKTKEKVNKTKRKAEASKRSYQLLKLLLNKMTYLM
jgi:hypothetical protein